MGTTGCTRRSSSWVLLWSSLLGWLLVLSPPHTATTMAAVVSVKDVASHNSEEEEIFHKEQQQQKQQYHRELTLFPTLSSCYEVNEGEYATKTTIFRAKYVFRIVILGHHHGECGDICGELCSPLSPSVSGDNQVCECGGGSTTTPPVTTGPTAAVTTAAVTTAAVTTAASTTAAVTTAAVTTAASTTAAVTTAAVTTAASTTPAVTTAAVTTAAVTTAAVTTAASTTAAVTTAAVTTAAVTTAASTTAASTTAAVTTAASTTAAVTTAAATTAAVTMAASTTAASTTAAVTTAASTTPASTTPAATTAAVTTAASTTAASTTAASTTAAVTTAASTTAASTTPAATTAAVTTAASTTAASTTPAVTTAAVTTAASTTAAVTTPASTTPAVTTAASTTPAPTTPAPTTNPPTTTTAARRLLRRVRQVLLGEKKLGKDVIGVVQQELDRPVVQQELDRPVVQQELDQSVSHAIQKKFLADYEDKHGMVLGLLSCGAHKAYQCEDCTKGGHGKFWCNGDCGWDATDKQCKLLPNIPYTHPGYKALIEQYAFQPVRNERHHYVNIILVRATMNEDELVLYHAYKHDILFLGIMSYETFPFPSPNPFSNQFPEDQFIDMFPGWLNMYRNPEEIFPEHVKILQMSQSDFTIPQIEYDQEVLEDKHDKLYDFAYAMSPGDSDFSKGCDTWGSFAKNWTFVASQALEVMCGELDMTGVLFGTVDAHGNACKIPPSCEGKILQTPFLKQDEAWDYIRHSKFLFIPQVYDASPRIATQALGLNVPLLMNQNIVGGWKYINEETGEFFQDRSDLKESIETLLGNLDTYTPRDYITREYGDEIAGVKLFNFVQEYFGNRVVFPSDTERLIPIFN